MKSSRIPTRSAATGLALCVALLAPACGGGPATDTAAKPAATAGTQAAPGADGKIAIDDQTFGCISNLQPVRGFFVGNLLGNVEATLQIARSDSGGVYPAGSVVQLIPTEVMVKQSKGFNSATGDWEFFELDVSGDGTKIRKRGFADVVNRFGGNCFGCHVKARPEWDLICETGHGCDPIPLTPAMFRALQNTDPRCPNSDRVSAEDASALQALATLTAPPQETPVKSQR
jgi:hypothetical protein